MPRTVNDTARLLGRIARVATENDDAALHGLAEQIPADVPPPAPGEKAGPFLVPKGMSDAKVGTEDRRKLVQTLIADLHEFRKRLRTEFGAATLAHYQVPTRISPVPANTTTTSIEGRITPVIWQT